MLRYATDISTHNASICAQHTHTHAKFQLNINTIQVLLVRNLLTFKLKATIDFYLPTLDLIRVRKVIGNSLKEAEALSLVEFEFSSRFHASQ